MQKLAIGIKFDDGLTWSIDTDENDPQTIADALAKHNSNGTPDEILLIVPDEILLIITSKLDNTPIVVEHWNIYKNYQPYNPD